MLHQVSGAGGLGVMDMVLGSGPVVTAVLWLLSPYWNRADMLLVRCHMKAMLWVVITVVLGIMVDPNRALNGGRPGAKWSRRGEQVAAVSWSGSQAGGATTSPSELKSLTQ